MDSDKAIVTTGNSKPTKKQNIIIPDSARRRDPGDSGSYINSFAKRIEGLILEANLAPCEEGNIHGLVKKEVEIVFRDSLRTADQRIEHWMKRKRTDNLNQWLADMHSRQSVERAEAAREIGKMIRNEIPDGYELTADDNNQIMARFKDVKAVGDIGFEGVMWIKRELSSMLRTNHSNNLRNAEIAEQLKAQARSQGMKQMGNQQVP